MVEPNVQALEVLKLVVEPSLRGLEVLKLVVEPSLRGLEVLKLVVEPNLQDQEVPKPVVDRNLPSTEPFSRAVPPWGRLAFAIKSGTTVPGPGPFFARFGVAANTRRRDGLAIALYRSVLWSQWAVPATHATTEVRRFNMLRSMCLNVVRASAMLVCVGVTSNACWVDGREPRHEGREVRHEERHEDHREERR